MKGKVVKVMINGPAGSGYGSALAQMHQLAKKRRSFKHKKIVSKEKEKHMKSAMRGLHLAHSQYKVTLNKINAAPDMSSMKKVHAEVGRKVVMAKLKLKAQKHYKQRAEQIKNSKTPSEVAGITARLHKVHNDMIPELAKLSAKEAVKYLVQRKKAKLVEIEGTTDPGKLASIYQQLQRDYDKAKKQHAKLTSKANYSATPVQVIKGLIVNLAASQSKTAVERMAKRIEKLYTASNRKNGAILQAHAKKLAKARYLLYTEPINTNNKGKLQNHIFKLDGKISELKRTVSSLQNGVDPDMQKALKKPAIRASELKRMASGQSGKTGGLGHTPATKVKPLSSKARKKLKVQMANELNCVVTAKNDCAGKNQKVRARQLVKKPPPPKSLAMTGAEKAKMRNKMKEEFLKPVRL